MMRDERNRDEDLNREYQLVYQDMLRYLSSKNISRRVEKDIQDDILAMALESQERGLQVDEVFQDYQEFCDAVCENAVCETRIERLLGYWKMLSTIIVVWVLFDLIGFGVNDGEYVENGLLIISWKAVAFYAVTILGCTVLIRWHNRRSFHRILGAWYTYLIAYGVVCLAVMFFPHILISYFHISLGLLRIPLWVFWILTVSCVCTWIAFFIIQKKQYERYLGEQKKEKSND
ncbi:hypothetical protein MKA58_07805 [[Clostridium] innocuum]|nr:hypothetical protein [[Clostridium] innocuum]